jgi:hypothetical protein
MRIKLEPGRLSLRQAATWAGVKESTAANWITQGLVELDGAQGLDRDAVLQLCVFGEVVDATGFERARKSWLRVRDELRSSWDATYLKLVTGEDVPIAEIARSSDELDTFVSSGDAVRVIDLHPLISKVRIWHETEARAHWRQVQTSSSRRQRGTGSSSSNLALLT